MNPKVICKNSFVYTLVDGFFIDVINSLLLIFSDRIYEYTVMSEYNYEQDIEVQREEAFEEGEKLGRKEGQKLFAALVEKLIEAGRSEDVIKAAQDFELCEKLYQEYDIE